MIANSAFLAAMVVMLTAFFVAGELSFLAPYKALILHQYGSVILAAVSYTHLTLPTILRV